MSHDHSIAFFDTQFRQASGEEARRLNPFEQRALPYLEGSVLDFGCGLGNLACAAAAKGCHVTALDASSAAIEQLQARIDAESLSVVAAQADLRNFPIRADYDCIVAVGLLMFFDGETARRVLGELQASVRPGGIAIVNVLIEGTTFMDMFDPDAHCLLSAGELTDRFAGWDILREDIQSFEAPRQTVKLFSTLIARKPNIPFSA